MRLLTQNEKSTLIFLTTSAMCAIAVSIYLGVNIQRKKEDILSNKIYLMHTGGEIEKDFMENYQNKMGKYDIHSYQQLQKSSNIVPNDWNIIASDIANKYHNYDAFVIVCGKDTLVYTASALSFMMENLSKPIILTDGEVKSAIKLASTTKIPEVMVVSNGKLLRGCRTIHKSTDNFASPNYPPLDKQNSLTFPKEPVQIKFIDPKINVIVIKVFPGMNASSFLNLLDKDNVNGIVLEIYGIGNAPTSTNFLDAIKQLASKGIVILAVSQCDDLSKNELDVDIRLLEAGVLSGHDMTTPAAYAKLCFLLANVKNKKLIGQLVEKTFRGEMTLNFPTIQ